MRIVLGLVALLFSSVLALRSSSTGFITPTFSSQARLWIAFASNRDGKMAIYVMASDGSNVHRLTDTNGNSFPVWSPDGRKIAFISRRDGNPQIYVMNADGTNAVNISHNAESDSSPSWSPDGKRIVFANIHDEYSSSQLYIMNADGTNRIKISPEALSDAREPTWSPDGKLIAFSAYYGVENVDIYIMHSDGSKVTKLLDNAYCPAWLPNGQFLASLNRMTGLGLISITDVSTGKTERTLDLIDGMWPAWSPTGEQIAFAAEVAPNHSQVFIANSDGSNRTNVSKNKFYDTHPAWSPVPLTIHRFPAELTPVQPTSVAFPSLTPAPRNPAVTEEPIQNTLFAQATIILQTVTAQSQQTRPTYSADQIKATQTAEKATLSAQATRILATVTAQTK